MGTSGFNQKKLTFDSILTISKKAVYKGINTAGDCLSFLFGEQPALQVILTRTNWWLVSAILGLVIALTRLIHIGNSSVCYLFAQDQVNGLKVTLPEAIAAARARSWFNLFLEPLLLPLFLMVTAGIIRLVSRWLNGRGGFNLYFGIITSCTSLFIFGQIIGYIIVNAHDLKGISDLRDLTPGVGLGLLPLFKPERIGLFYHEVVRGFDLFGLWVVLLLTAMFHVMENFKKGKSLLLAGIYYSVFIAIRWMVEGFGNQLWYYFWNYGNY